MRLEVPDSALAETTACPYDFSCLETGNCGDRTMCEVTYRFGMNILFVLRKDSADCPYSFSFDSDCICNCPTRYAIHRKHQR